MMIPTAKNKATMISIFVDGIEYRPFDHLFAVSRCGKILRKLKPYTPTIRKDGYLGIGRQRLMHRVVAICWLDNPDGKKQVHHINGDKADNRVENLEWVTPKEHFSERHAGLFGHYVRSEETREKIRQFRLGKVTSEETKAKQRAALLGRKRPFIPRAKHTKEWKTQMRKSHFKNTSCKIHGVVYRSFAEAARVTGIHRFTLRKRCLSKNFPEYELVTPTQG